MSIIQRLEILASLGIVYHYTDAFNLAGVLDKNAFMLSTNLGTNSDRTNTEKYPYFFSLTRSTLGGYHERSAGDLSCLIELDYDYLSSRYKILPVDYWGSDMRKSDHRMNEMEERLISNRQQIPLPNPPTKLIKSVHLLLDAKNPRDTKFNYRLRRLLIALKIKHIPIFIYDKRTNWLTRNISKAIPLASVLNRVAGPNNDKLGSYHRRNWLANYSALWNINDYSRLDKRQRQMVDNVSGFYLNDFIQTLQADIHNNRSNPQVAKLVNYIQSKGGIQGFADYIAKKFAASRKAYYDIQ